MLDGSAVEDVRLAVYQNFVDTGTVPAPDRLGELTGLVLTQVREALRRLHDHRDVVLDRAGYVLMAHPFTSMSMGFSVMGRQTLWWGGCAWDSFAMPHLLPGEPSVLVATRCPGCGTPHDWTVGRDAPPVGDQIAHFLIPINRLWDDVLTSCGNQRIFCDESCVAGWLGRTGHQRGYLMDLATLWRLARGWYAGRLSRGYQRREPVAASTYFRGVGLTGPFWGLPDES